MNRLVKFVDILENAGNVERVSNFLCFQVSVDGVEYLRETR